MDLSRTSDSQGFIKNSHLTLNYPRLGEGHLASSPYTHSKDKEILSSQGLLNSMALNFSAKVEGQHSSFPYGLSGVAMPNYAYTGDLYQFTSNGYPRKSRTCSYCSKVFTRSTTRRYHEKRCPRLRAAVCGIVQDDDKKSKFPQLPSPHGRNTIDSSTSGYDKLSGNSLKPHMASTSKSAMKFKGGDSVESQASVMKKETQEHLASLFGDKSRIMSDSHHMADLHSALAAYKQSHFRTMSLSPFHLQAAMEFKKSPSRTANGQRDDQDSNDGMASANGSDLENLEKLRKSIENDEFKFDEMSKLMKRESPSSEGGMMGHSDENGKSEQNNNGENLNQPENAANIKCEVCGKMFASSWQLHVHSQIHTKFKPYACRFCGERFSKAALRINHERIHDAGTTEHVHEAEGSNSELFCAICGSSFTKKDNLRLHIHKTHQVGPWLCRNCGKAAISHQDLFNHLKNHNLPPNEVESLQYLQDMANGMVVEDNINGVSDDLEDEELEEMNESDSNENLTSPEQESPSEISMNLDGDGDSSEEKEMCNICGRDIPKSRMGLHLKSHEGQKPYECPICKKRFGYKNNMKSHIKLHDGIKPYQCNICGAKFTRGSTLRRHARRHGISAESVWDLFVKNDSQQGNHVANLNPKSEMMNLSGASLSDMPSSKFTDTSPYGNFNSMFSLPTSVAMSNALFMNYHNQAMSGASLPSLFSLQSTSEIPPSSAGFNTSSQSEQKDALNLSVHKDTGTDNEIPSPTSISRSRSRSLSGSDSIKNEIMGTSVKPRMSDVGVQVKSCCKMGNDIHPLMGAPRSPRSPSEASIQSGESAATYHGGNLAALENSADNIAALIAAGKLYKCEPCECYFSEYAMYRIHSKIHPGGRTRPFSCPICSEDCHDKVYFSLHVSEHLR